MHDKVVLITGAARRVGAGIARHLHEHGWRLALHCRGSRAEADDLAEQLNAQRAGSTMVLQADLLDNERLPGLVDATVAAFGRLDALVNNASSFFPTEVGEVTEAAWHDLMGSNLKAPLFLAQAAAPHLAACGGAIVGIVDIHAERPMKSHLVYNLAKAGHAQLIRSLAIELAPKVRVNGVAPGSNVWPEGDSFFDSKLRTEIEASIPLQRTGTPDDIARTVRFLLDDAPYITGQIIAVDGGRSVVL
ncbi:pteridine reductase [Crenobacter sp. SG2303]|uniref:Pteridine reductase n=1 Tax=Crenobacter oryzisoli TaxID=3056844 RepID=A0ABT7XQ43_9NEIS|nr:pteridine reductase [Crenobacter sp. SG2303]MDN0075911.1 pteridine reductase [Crenobacter sp. SG2303]